MLIDDKKLKNRTVEKPNGEEYLNSRYVSGDDNIKTDFKTEVGICAPDSRRSSLCGCFQYCDYMYEQELVVA